MPTTTIITEPTHDGRYRVVDLRPNGCTVLGTYSTRKIADLCRDLWRIGADVKAEKLPLIHSGR